MGLVCSKCKESKQDSDFYRDKRRSPTGARGGMHYMCKHCMFNARRAGYHIRQLAVWAFKDAPCADCGRKYPPCAMDFDHLYDKEYLVSRLVNVCASWDRILNEIAKCEVVCATCHRIRTARRKDWTIR